MMRLVLALLLAPLGACDDGAADQGFQGYVEGEYLRIAAPDAGWLESVAVAKGARVAAGALLFTLEPRHEAAAVNEARARLAQAASDLADLRLGSRPEEIAAIEAQLADANASLTLANLTLDRNSKLISTNAVSRSQLDSSRAAALQAAAQVARIRAQLAVAHLPARRDRIMSAESSMDAARHSLEQAEWHLAQRRVTSPADALVDDVVRRPGEWVPANGTVVSLLPPGAIKVVFFVPEPRRAAIRPDATVFVACTGCPSDLTARVSRIASEVEYTPPVIFSRETRAKLVFRIEASLENVAGVPMPGQPVTVQVRP
jgi:HlyD family secretion protein